MGIFKSLGGSSSSNHTCPTLSLYESKTDPITGSWTFHKLNLVISGAAVAFSCLSIFILMANHAMHLSKPNEQLKIMRICLLIPVYGILCFLSVVAPEAYVYLHPWTDLAQAVALGNFFLLLCELVSPNGNERDTFFAALKVPAKKKRRNGGASSAQDGLTWYRRKWIAIFQFTPVSILIGIFTCITQAAKVYCLTSNKPYFAHLWLNIIHFLSLFVAVMSVLQFYKALRSELSSHKPLAKLLAFKLLVFLNFVLQIIFMILNGISPSPLAPTSQLSYSDMTVGIPMLINCLLMVPFSIFFHWAYDVTSYHLSHTPATAFAATVDNDLEEMRPVVGNANPPQNRPIRYQGGPLGIKAWVWVWNPMELIHAIVFSFTMFSESRKAGGSGRGAYVYEQSPGLGDQRTSYEGYGRGAYGGGAGGIGYHG
ncbi:hypothetical protein M406DRAFT_247007 [Cryphonectria parasitica EP155]|uniref:DUF300-domain-containing protein n=1 Tax=Cryphonectria parasitica (strain ATCC 38755 / EP155) TaxID=660469 RepID=A0A9P5CV18_CRYP1|nr:uncharacterized protein M406DRAFT_247007 [Cryphonectria parasitica EP155]KAF3770465.1 hypothetical protein M406DRAFT_247007 [Cryphonectria parasitica EP155]